MDLKTSILNKQGQPASIDTVSGGTPLALSVERAEGGEGGGRGDFRPLVDVPWALALLVTGPERRGNSLKDLSFVH